MTLFVKLIRKRISNLTLIITA